MLLTCLSSESAGNCYLLESKDEVLIIEIGIKLTEVKKALSFDLSKMIGAIVSHGHRDHLGYPDDFAKAGISIHTSQDALSGLSLTGHRFSPIEAGKQFKLGEFTILPFDVPHGVKCLGFLIEHKDCGKLLFATDCAYLPNKFVGLNNVMLEVNYEDSMLQNDRAVGRHLSLDTATTFLRITDLTHVQNIVLLHLSSQNSSSRYFHHAVKEIAPNANVYIADKGLQIELNKYPF